VIEANGFVVSGPFRHFVEQHGGLERLGVPLTNELRDAELGVQVQYFTFARLELHGSEVRLTRLGSLRATGLEHTPPFQWLPADTPLDPGRRYFPASGHTLGGAFGWYHVGAGDVRILGLPISEEHWELQPGGTQLLVQYFERAVLRYHPGSEGGEVRQAPLGAWMAELHLAQAERTPGPELQPLATARITYSVGTPWAHNIELAAVRLHGSIVEPGATLGFLRTVGAISEQTGYRPGPAIESGELVEDLIGGGICSVATLLYRAAWQAGLPVLERRGHSRWLSAYADIPGMDAAVADPGPELRVQNNTGRRLFVGVQAANGIALLTLWGYPDGRRVEVSAPLVSEGEGSIVVQNSRVVRDRAGIVLRRDRVSTSYAR
jgi:hypothetical protein